MAVAYQSISTTVFASSTTVVITKPSGLAVGDQMLATIFDNDNDETNITAPAGWTTLTGDHGIGAQRHFYKTADASDVAASNFTFSLGGTKIVGGAILRFTGAAISEATIGTYASDTSPLDWANGITPAYADSLLFNFIVQLNTSDNLGSTSGYAIATDNPTWTELYDFSTNSLGDDMSMACAYGSRPETTATGNSSATGTGGNAYRSVLISIPQLIDVSVTLDTPNIALTDKALTVTGDANITLDTPTINLTQKAPTITGGTNKWTNKDKTDTSPTITNKDKS